VSEIVGRGEELCALRAFIEEARPQRVALVLHGEPGIGKSTLWLAGIEHARDRGLRTLVSRPAEAERHLAHAGLGDLFDEVLDEVLPSLRPPRRRALEVAMLRDEAAGNRVDRRALAVALRDALELLGEREPVLIAVDDVQWLDPSSSRALAFALRRLPADVRLLLTRRVDGKALHDELEQSLSPDRVLWLPIRPLTIGALHQYLRDRIGRAFARQTLLRIHERSAGNPFFALEIARALDVEADPLEPLPVPTTLEELLRTRIAKLPPSTREALSFASAVGSPTERLLETAGVSADALEPALTAGMIERENGTIRFTHPLLSSVLYQALGAEQRRVHDRLAQMVEDPLLRTRHLALSRSEPDAAVATELDLGARRAQDLGAFAVAAELGEHAIRLTPRHATDERYRRGLTAPPPHQAAGEWTRARTIAVELLTAIGVGSWRAETLILLAELESLDRGAELLDQALREPDVDPALASLIHCRLAWARRFRDGFNHATAALELAEQVDNDLLRARARAVLAILGWFKGEEETSDDLPALLEHLPDALGAGRLVQEAAQAIVNTYAPISKRDTARALLQREYEEWIARDEPRSARALWGLAWVDFWAGRWQDAARHAAAAHDISIQYALEVPQDHLPIAVIAVHRGELELARQHSERGLDLAEEQFGMQPPQHLAVLGLVEGWGGDGPRALDWFDKAGDRASALGWGEPSVRWWTADHAELLLEQGLIDPAVELLAVWESDARRLSRDWVLAHIARCRGLVAAARGEVAPALALLTQAAAEHDGVGDPYGRARALLALGTVSRRARQKRAAREAVEAALAGFEQVGALGWAAKAQAELGRLGGRRREDGLTAAERRVARLVAEGKTNREVAAALFLGERTVASHLTHIYGKLGIRSRTELAHRLSGEKPA